MIEAEGLSRSFDGLRAVDSLTVSVPKGSVFGFLGRNGAGKTTTVKVLSTVLRPTSGTAAVGGYDIKEEPLNVRSIIGVIGEGTELARPFWTPVEYLRFFARLQGWSGKDADAELTKWLKRLDLASHARRPIGGFSAGMKKRLELCRVFSRHPEVLLLDEPTKELDIPGKREIWELLRELAKGEQVTLFLCSHDTSEVQALCDRIGILRNGKLAFEGTKAGLPRSVIRIESEDPHRIGRKLQETVPVLSWTATGNFLYVAFRGETRVAELMSLLEPEGCAIRKIEEADSFDERVLAFL